MRNNWDTYGISEKIDVIYYLGVRPANSGFRFSGYPKIQVYIYLPMPNASIIIRSKTQNHAYIHQGYALIQCSHWYYRSDIPGSCPLSMASTTRRRAQKTTTGK